MFLIVTAIILIKNITVLDTLPLQITAALSLLIMLLLPVLSLTSIYRMKNMNMSSRNCKENVIEYSKRQSRFLIVQKWSVLISPIFMLTIVPPFLKISKGKDFFSGDSNHLIWFIPVALIALMIFVKWGYGCYIRITNDAKVILQELVENDHE